ncbi:hypothetical protein HOH45_01595, partial [bacterium]|nr:hypothetical protein [bacterium]
MNRFVLIFFLFLFFNINTEHLYAEPLVSSANLSIDERLTILNNLEKSINLVLTSLQENININRNLIESSLKNKNKANMGKEVFFHTKIPSENYRLSTETEPTKKTSLYKESPEIYEEELVEQQELYQSLIKKLNDFYRYFSLNKNKFFDNALFISKKMNKFEDYVESEPSNFNKVSELLIVTSKAILEEIERIQKKEEVIETNQPTGNALAESIPGGGLLDNWLTAIKTESQADFLVSGYKRVDFSYSKADTGTNTIKRQEEL